MLPLADLFVEVFVLIDDAIRSRGPDPTPARAHPACSDAEVLTIALGRHLLGRPSETTGLDNPPSEVRGLIERHEQLRGWRTRIREYAEDFSARTCRAAWRPTWSGRSWRASRRSVWRSNTAGEG
jgi:hypothetical protein